MDLTNPGLLWFLAGFVLIIFEFVIPGVIIVFFGLGAWIVSLLAFAGIIDTFDSQVLVFGISSVVLLILLRKLFKGRGYGFVTRQHDLGKDLDEFTGKTVTVLEKIQPNSGGGQVRFKGVPWKAVAEEELQQGDEAVIVAVDNITLKVRKK